MVSKNFLWELNLVFNNQVALLPITHRQQLFFAVNNEVASSLGGHSFPLDAHMCLGCNHLVRCHKNAATIKCLNAGWLRFESLNQRKLHKVVQMISISNEAACGLTLSKLDNKIRGNSSESLTAHLGEPQSCVLTKAWLDCDRNASLLLFGFIRATKQLLNLIRNFLQGTVIELEQ